MKDEPEFEQFLVNTPVPTVIPGAHRARLKSELLSHAAHGEARRSLFAALFLALRKNVAVAGGAIVLLVAGAWGGEKLYRSITQTVVDVQSAAVDGHYSAAVALTDPSSAVARQLADFSELAKLNRNGFKVVSVVANDRAALAVTTEIVADHGQRGPLVVTLIKRDGTWLLQDVDVETTITAKKELARFLERHPDAVETIADPSTNRGGMSSPRRKALSANEDPERLKTEVVERNKISAELIQVQAELEKYERVRARIQSSERLNLIEQLKLYSSIDTNFVSDAQTPAETANQHTNQPPRPGGRRVELTKGDSTPRTAFSTPGTTPDGLRSWRDLDRERTRLQRQLQEARGKYLDRHPVVRELFSKLANTEEGLSEAALNAADSFRLAYDKLKAREEQLKSRQAKHRKAPRL